jgi:hypothetical protein
MDRDAEKEKLKIEDAINNVLTGTIPFKLRDDACTLIIGLGGSGVIFASETKELLEKRYGANKVAEQVDFYCLDTDIAKKPGNITDNEFRRLTGLYEEPWIDGWLNPELIERKKRGELKDVSDGAGGVRQVGRWKLFSTTPFIMQDLDVIITKYGQKIGQKGINKIFVIVLAGICGGTGCGCLIDIPYFVRKMVQEKHLNEQTFEYYGMFELPDSKIESSNMNPRDEASSRANAYAAMKDLEYFMRGDTEYSAVFKGYDGAFSTRDRIYTRCFLLSNNAIGVKNTTKYNRNPLDKTVKKTYLDGAVPEAINIMLSTEKRKSKDGKDELFGFDSGMDNVRTKGFFPDPEKNGKELLVSTFGASKIEIPLTEIIIAIFNRIFIGLRDRWERITDEELIKNLCKNKVLPIFKIQEVFDLLNTLLDKASGIDEKEFVKNLSSRIQILGERERYQETIKKIREGIRETISDIYVTYGPFVALKVFEKDVYDWYVDNAMKKIKPPAYTGNLSAVWKDYCDLKPGFFKKDEKEKRREKLISDVGAYTRPRIYDLWEKQIRDIKVEISQKYHHELFERVTEMVRDVREIFRKITNIDTYTETETAPDATTFSWNFSGVPYDEISQKINFLFSRRISVRKGQDIVYIYTKRKINRVVNGKIDTSKELFYWPRSGEIIAVQYYNEEQNRLVVEENVVGIDEIFQFNSGPENDISIEELLKKFLGDIKDNTQADVASLIVKNFKDIIERFNSTAFTDLIILSSPKIDLSQPVSKVDSADKEMYFKNAIEKFNDFALPSFPVSSKYVANQLATRNYAVTLEPKFKPELNKKGEVLIDYENIIGSVQSGIIPREKTQRLVRDGLSMMIAVNFYFDYSFNSYIEMDSCKREYDKIKDTPAGAGIHVAEGEKDNIRLKLDI